METIEWKVNHHYQPTNNTCGYAALATFLSFYERRIDPEELVSQIPQPKDSEGTSHGSITAQLAIWCQEQGFKVKMFASDMYVLDLSWKNKDSTEIKDRLKEVANDRVVNILGEHWTKIYIDAYISMLDKGAKLEVTPFITTELLNELLSKGPVFVNICSSKSSGNGRTITSGLRESQGDDLNGNLGTHSVVLYGKNKNGEYLISDPWDGLITMNSEHLVIAIEAAQIECDNQIFVFES